MIGVNIELWSICTMMKLSAVLSQPQKMSYHVAKYAGMNIMSLVGWIMSMKSTT